MVNNCKKARAISDFLLVGFILLALSLSCFCFRIGIVRSGSMEPALMTDDLVIVRRFGGLETGDIVVYESQGQKIVHRIVSMDGNKIVTKGDANNTADDPIDIRQVRGAVVGRLVNLPIGIGQGLQAKFVTTASGTSSAEVARWDISALEDVPDTLLLTSGTEGYSDDGYGFSVNSDSETTAEYHITITVSCEDEDCQSSGLTLGLFKYDKESCEWYQVGESVSEVLEYNDTLPLGYSSDRFLLKVRADEETSGSFQAHITAEVDQID